VGLLHDLRVHEIDRTAGLERPGLAVLHRHEPRLGDADVEASGGQILELVATLAVGERRLRADVGAADPHLRAAHRGAGVGGDDPPAQAAGAGLGLASGRQHLEWHVARRDLDRLLRGSRRRGLDESDEKRERGGRESCPHGGQYGVASHERCCKSSRACLSPRCLCSKPANRVWGGLWHLHWLPATGSGRAPSYRRYVSVTASASASMKRGWTLTASARTIVMPDSPQASAASTPRP